jgi:ankyrin repeat protein
LLVQGGDINGGLLGQGGCPPIIAAVKAEALNVVEVLAAWKGEDSVEANDYLNWEMTDENSETPLMVACRLGFSAVVASLLKTKSRSIRSPLAQTVATQKGQVLCALIVATDPTVVKIHDVCKRGVVLGVEALLCQGVSVNCLDYREGMENRTPLMAACEGLNVNAPSNQRLKIVITRLLQDPAISVNKKNERGQTALMIAAGRGNVGICKTLIINGACTTDNDPQKQTTSWYAYNGWSAPDVRTSMGMKKSGSVVGESEKRKSSISSPPKSNEGEGKAKPRREAKPSAAPETMMQAGNLNALNYLLMTKVTRPSKETIERLDRRRAEKPAFDPRGNRAAYPLG